MKASTRDLFPMFYTAEETASSMRFIAQVDLALIQDGTYFVLEAGEEVVACGGWSRRDKLYTGSGDAAGDARILDPQREPARVRAMFVRSDWTRRGLGTRILEACEAAARAEGYRALALMATLPGEPLYASYGFHEVDRVEIAMPDGCRLAGVSMVKTIESDVR